MYLEAGNIARPMSDFVVDGKKVLCEFDVLKIFNDEAEAKEYEEKNNVNMIF